MKTDLFFVGYQSRDYDFESTYVDGGDMSAERLGQIYLALYHDYGGGLLLLAVKRGEDEFYWELESEEDFVL